MKKTFFIFLSLIIITNSMAGIGENIQSSIADETMQHFSVGNELVDFIWSGALTDNSIRIKVKVSESELPVRLAIDDDSLFSKQLITMPKFSLPESNNIVDFKLINLKADRQYYYRPIVNGVIDTLATGRFRTLTSERMSFTFALGSCSWTGSVHTVFETIRQLNPLFFFHLGDMHYENIGINNRDVFRNAFNRVLSSPTQSALYRSCPIVYIWDDHDYGPNNSDSTAPGRLASRLTYQEYLPHFPLVEGEGDAALYHSFNVGRVKFIVCDSRSARSPASAVDNSTKTMLGEHQKVWFKEQLIDGRDNYALTVWANSLPWIGVTGDDGWYIYTNERKEIANFIKENDITNICMISGDAHMIAIDDGSNSDYADGGGAPIPVLHAASLHRTPGIKGGPYSHGAFPGIGQFCLMNVEDNGDSIRVNWSGRTYQDVELVSYSFTYPVMIDFKEQVYISPDTLYAAALNSIHEISAEIRVGNLENQIPVDLIDVSTLLIEDIPILSISTESGNDNFNGNAIVIQVELSALVEHFYPFYNWSVDSLLVTGQLSDGSPIHVSGQVSLRGYTTGDINLDGAITIDDLLLLVQYMFQGKDIPDNNVADHDKNRQIDISDLTAQVNLIF